MTTDSTMLLGPNEFKLLTHCEQVYMMIGQLPTERAVVQSGFSKAIFTKCIHDPKFNLALSQRGIKPYNELLSDGSVDQTLTAEQLNCANVILDLTDNRSRKKKLADLRIPTQKFETWLRDPHFQNYLRVRGEAALGDHSSDAHLALIEGVRRGDMKAIQYYNELTGRFIPARDKGIDVQSILLRIMEIIQIRVEDPATQALIADDLLALAHSAGANPISGGQVIQAVPVGFGSSDGERSAERTTVVEISEPSQAGF